MPPSLSGATKRSRSKAPMPSSAVVETGMIVTASPTSLGLIASASWATGTKHQNVKVGIGGVAMSELRTD